LKNYFGMTKDVKHLQPYIIDGAVHNDHRGTVAFVNDFDMSPIKRMYTITHPSTTVVRAWQAHKIEAKYFKCTKGRFVIAIVPIKDWNTPDVNSKPKVFILQANKNQVLCVPKGHANGFKALEANSELIVFSDQDLESAKNDQYRFDQDLWMDWSVK
tara:strand:+ start:63809 stop:64279 length:471 start_codon:yes stop_codon:yes gene_type:complete